MKGCACSIPENNKDKHNIRCLFWLLARMVLHMRGTVAPGRKWDVMVDLFFYRDPGEVKENEENDAVLAGPDYGAVVEYQRMGAADQWSSVDAYWNDAAVPVPAAATGADWGDRVPIADGWAATSKPSEIAAPGVEWEEAAAALPPTTTGWFLKFSKLDISKDYPYSKTMIEELCSHL